MVKEDAEIKYVLYMGGERIELSAPHIPDNYFESKLLEQLAWIIKIDGDIIKKKYC
jgi:hypothetical protein